MLTPLGMFLRKLRLDNDQLLRDMAERLDMPSSTLSAIETGRRKPPQGFAEKVGRAYALADELEQSLYSCVSEASGWSIGIDASSLSKGDRNTAIAFARRFSDLDDEDKDRIWDILNKGKE